MFLIKKLLSLILLHIVLLTLAAGCTGEPSPSSIAPSLPPASNMSKVHDYLDAFIPPAGQSIFDLTVSDKGEIFYAASTNELRKIDLNGNDTVINDGHINYTLLRYYNGKLNALILEGTYKLYEFDGNGKELARYDLNIDDNLGYPQMIEFSGTNKICLSRGNINGRGLLGYIYDKDTGELTELVNRDIVECLGFYPFSNGDMYMTKDSGSPLKITLNGDRLTYTDTGYGENAIHNLYFDSVTQTAYSVFFASPPEISAVDLGTGEMIRLAYMEGNPQINGEYFNGVLYYMEENAVKYLDLYGLLLSYHAREEKVELQILFTHYLSSVSGYSTLGIFIRDFTTRYPNITVKTTVMPDGSLDNDWANNTNDHRFLTAFLSGEYTPDILAYNADTASYYWDRGVLKDLNQFIDLKKAVDNPALINGFQNLCVSKKGHFLGVPFEARYGCYLLNKDLFNEHGIPLPGLGASDEEILTIGEKYCDDYSKSGQSGVYLYREPFNQPLFKFAPSRALNADNDFTPPFNTQAFIDYMYKEENPVRYRFNVPYEAGAEYNILFDLHYFEPSSYCIGPAYAGTLDPKTEDLDKYYFWGNKTEIEGIYQGTYINYNLLGVVESSKNADWAARFLTEYLNEDFQRENGQDFLYYKDINNHRRFKVIPESFEPYAEYAYQNYIETYDIPGLFYWMNTELYPLYQSTSEMTLEDAAERLQREAERRLKG